MYRPASILALGDSLTEGYGLPSGCAFPDVLEELLTVEGHNVNIVNLGLSGDTTAGGLRRMTSWLSRHPAPDAAIVELGVNDAFMGIDFEEIHDNLDAILSRLTSEGIPVLLAGMKLPFPASVEDQDSYEAIFAALAQKHNTVFYPHFLQDVFGVPAFNLPDGIHPNEKGIKRIAQNMLPSALSLLQHVSSK
ncbi:arylesterase [Oleidesulfovibrio sp.]|uniref:arylesterase n=1 Tax=Oleidesulfovibrio sp. TaxID=2909707 RepID=UPI003A8AAB76